MVWDTSMAAISLWKHSRSKTNCWPLPRPFLITAWGSLLGPCGSLLHGVYVSVLCFSGMIGRGGRRPLCALSARKLGKFSTLKFIRLGFLRDKYIICFNAGGSLLPKFNIPRPTVFGHVALTFVIKYLYNRLENV